MQDDRINLHVIQHKQDLFVLTGRILDSFETVSRMWDEITSYRRYAENYNFNQV